MVSRTSIVFACAALLVLAVATLAFVGRGPEEGSAVAKEFVSYLTHDLSAFGFVTVSQRTVPSSEVTLPVRKALKHETKRVLIALGLSEARASYAAEFRLQSKQSSAPVYCRFRVHGDQVLAIAIHSASIADSSAIHLRELLHSAFPEYDIPMLSAVSS